MPTVATAASTIGATARDPRWPRILARDPAADGIFWYSVLTTGVFCRPSCPSRAARPENVLIHASLAEARATGFRPCRRCRPEAAGLAAAADPRVVAACRMIAAAGTVPALSALAAAAGLSPTHFHRLFKAATGVSPRAYGAALRRGRVGAALARAATVTDAIHAAGFGSSGRFYEGSTAMLGMTPSRYRAGGAGEALRVAVAPCSLGRVLVAASDKGIAAILLGDADEALRAELGRRFPHARFVEGNAAFAAQVEAVVALVDAPDTAAILPLDIRGTAFQQRVWAALRAIPPGRTMSYAELAAAIGAPTASRAVAGACAANAHAVAIPCHRVVRGDGTLSGYRWGVPRKAALLAREKARDTPA